MLLSLLLAFALPVTSQRDFDRLDERIDSVLATGERNIEVCFEPGTYFFGEEHLKFTEIEAEGVSLRLIGNGATLVGSRDSEEVPAFGNGFVDLEKGEYFDALAPVRKAGFWPIHIPFSKGVYAVRAKDEADVSEADASGMKIILSQWFVGAVYDVVKVSKGWIYFRRVPYRTRIWSELRFGRCLPRYMLFSPRKAASAYPCAASNFLSVDDSRFGSIVLEGFHFLGNGDGGRLLRFSGMEADSVVIRRCSFEGIRSRGIRGS